MNSVEFDKVKAEKVQAMRMYKRKRNFASVFAALISASLLSSPSFSYAVETAGDLLRESELFLNRPVFIFTLLNVIIAVVFFLSGQKATPQDLYDEYVGSKRIAAALSGEESLKTESPLPKESNQIVLVNNAVRDIDAANTVTDSDRSATDDSVIPLISCETVKTVSPVKEKRSYCRIQSENFENSESENGRELRRSETVAVVEMAVAETPRRSMDDLSNEEFRLTIETFIAAKKKTLIQEKIAERKGHGNGAV